MVKAAPVLYDMEILKKGCKVSAVFANSGNANACTGAEGYNNCQKIAETYAAGLGVKSENVLIASTGVIGMPLPVEKIINVKDVLIDGLADDNGINFAKAIKDRPEAEASFRKKCVWAGNIILFPIIRLLHIHSLRKSYQQAYRYADKVVLLSQSFIPQFQKFGRINDASKFVIIPNGLSFDKFVNKKEIDAKKNIALIVSRLDETHKRLSLAFKIWKNVQSQIPEDWELIVVGDGKDYNKYQKFIKHNHIDNVIMVGRKDPVPYYKSASVFVMTSRSESWGLTLTEAQQFGVVPIAFNAYSSLSDIIENSKNGIIVPECDIASYEKQLLNLINNKLERTKLAVNAVESSRQFSKDIIVQKWWNLLNSIIA